MFLGQIEQTWHITTVVETKITKIYDTKVINDKFNLIVYSKDDGMSYS